MKRRVCIVTGTRAEYGLLRRLIDAVHASTDLQLQLVVTGSHLSPEFGSTYKEIEAGGFPIAERVEMLVSSDTASGVAKSTGLGFIGFADAFTRLQPDILVILGDRFEMLAVAGSAMFMRIPIAHLHGGETTEGAFDESIRHAVTKMSHLHFVATEAYRRRVMQLGEHPDRVFNVGGLGVDAILHLPLLDRASVERTLGVSLSEKSLLVTLHPTTLGTGSQTEEIDALLAALEPLNGTQLIFTLPNADNGGRGIASRINAFAASRANAHVFASLGQLHYFSCMQYVDGVVGNSSSGLAEAPSFHVGTINIGERQRGRPRATSVIDVAPEPTAISSAIERLYDPAFRREVEAADNPYGRGGATEEILRVLSHYPLEGLRKKVFYDLPSAAERRL